jgi:uncharacterized protein
MLRKPIPTRMLIEGSNRQPSQTAEQREVEFLVREYADKMAASHGITRRRFLRTASGMAMAFFAMNKVYGRVFDVEAAEMVDKDAAIERSRRLSGQFIFDVQLHFVSESYPSNWLVGLRERAQQWNMEIAGKPVSINDLKFRNFLKEVYLDSDTTIGLLSNAPSDQKDKWFLSNDDAAEAKRIVNELAGSNRLLCHTVITPGQPDWLDEVDRAIAELKPDSWKGYTAGSPMGDSRYPWRLDDEKLVYPAYERMVKAGIRTVCIHKGLLPPDDKKTVPTWHYATVEDVPKVAKDWPDITFVIYHSALDTQPLGKKDYLGEFEKTGRIPWVSDLAEIPGRFGVKNVYAEIGSTFASSCIAHPKYCAAILGTLIKGFGADHVVWGTDSIWYGSPQWQIEAMRRIEIPEEMQKKYGFEPLGPADGKLKAAIFGQTSAKMYGLKFAEIEKACRMDYFSSHYTFPKFV